MPSRIRSSIKVDALHDSLLRCLASGEFTVGDRFHTTQKIADLFQVSYVTAHRAMSQLEKSGYLKRDNGRGTYVKELYAGPLKTIGIPLRLESNPSTVELYQAISRIAESRGIRVLMGDGSREEEFFDEMAKNRTDAIIRFPQSAFKEVRYWEALRRNALRAVFLNDWVQDGGPFPTVRTDEIDALNLLLDHLFENGHRKILLRQEAFTNTRYHLTEAFLKWHWRHELQVEANAVQHIGFEYMTPAFFEGLLQDGYTAICCSYAVDAIHIMGLESYRPFAGSFSMVAIEDIADAEKAGLTVYAQNTELLARTAIDLLSNAPRKTEKTVDVPGRLILRNSVKNIRKD